MASDYKSTFNAQVKHRAIIRGTLRVAYSTTYLSWYLESRTQRCQVTTSSLFPTVQAIRAQFDSFTTNENLITDNNNKKCVLWGDSEIPYLQQMTDPARVKESIWWGIYFSKIEAKITKVAQPLDPALFKILKSSGRNCKSVVQPTTHPKFLCQAGYVRW